MMFLENTILAMDHFIHVVLCRFSKKHKARWIYRRYGELKIPGWHEWNAEMWKIVLELAGEK